MQISSILIIDDEIEVCTLIRDYLIKKEREANFSTTLSEGKQFLIDLKPGILILDNNLPDGFGIDAVASFKELLPDLKVVLISARSDLREEAIGKGADHFMEKPISFGRLNEILATY